MWSPTHMVLNGVFATHADLVAATDGLAVVTRSPVVVATFSAYYLIPSLSCAEHPDPVWSADTIAWLQEELQRTLRGQADPVGFVSGLLKGLLETVGVSAPATRSFGGDLERSGKLAVTVCAGRRLETKQASASAELVAAAVLGSRAAAFTRENSIELSVLRASRRTSEDLGMNLATLVASASRHSTYGLLVLAQRLLGTSAIVAYEADQRNPHRFTFLDRKAEVLATQTRPTWIPPRVSLTENQAVPATPELGGSRFQSLDELASHCVTSRRRLVGLVSHANRAFGVPYGLDHVRERPIGVVCMVWGSEDDRIIGIYEMAVSRMVALHLAREYDERRSADSVQLVTRQLGFISDLPMSMRWSASRHVVRSCRIGETSDLLPHRSRK